MTKGRPKDPTRTKRKTGHRRKPNEAPKLAVVPPPTSTIVLEPPDHLSDEAKDVWRSLVDLMAGAVPLRESDLLGLEAIVRQYLRMRQTGDIVDKYGVVTRNESGAVIASPFLKAERDATGMLLRFLEQYGLTVGARMRLGLMQLAGKTLAQSLSEDLES